MQARGIRGSNRTHPIFPTPRRLIVQSPRQPLGIFFRDRFGYFVVLSLLEVVAVTLVAALADFDDLLASIVVILLRAVVTGRVVLAIVDVVFFDMRAVETVLVAAVQCAFRRASTV